MKYSRSLRRRSIMEPLELRCVMDAAGFDLPFQASEAQSGPSVPAQIASSVAGVAASNPIAANEIDLQFFNFDVDGSGDVSPLDVLVVINAINNQSFESGQFATDEVTPRSTQTFDVDGDSQIGPLDVLVLINELNRRAQQSSGIDNITDPVGGDEVLAVTDPSGEQSVAVDDGDGQFVFPRDCHWLHLQGGRSFLAPSSVVTAGKSDGTLYLVSVDGNGNVTAIANGVSASVEIGDDSTIRLDGANTGLKVIDMDGTFVFLTSDSFPEFTIGLP